MGKRILISIFALLALWGTARFCHHQTKGFRLSKLKGNTSCLPQVSPPLPDELRSVMSQKFHYIGRGLQSFCFVSDDQTTVLKLFNNRYQNRLFWLRLFPSKEKTAYSLKKWKMAFTSYQIAYDHLREETGLYYLHPTKSTDCPKVTLIDPIGVSHQVDLNDYGFALQKKVTLAYPYFAACVKEKDFQKAQNGFFSLFSLIKKKMDLGIADKDPLIRTNFGFYDGQAIQIDIGPLSYNSSQQNLEKQSEEIQKIALPLRHWIENYYPQLLPFFYDALENF